MADNLKNPKQIEDPDNEGQMIDNPDYDDTLNEDGTPIDDKDDLKPIKESLNKAYKARDDALDEVKRLKKEKRDAEVQKLKDEGKEKEHYEALISDKDAEIADLNKQVVELTRDNEVRTILGGYTFKNARAANLAYGSVVDELVQDDKGKWTHKSGKSISDFVKTFAEDDENTFLFTPKENRGTQTPPHKSGDKRTTTQGKLLRDLPQSEVLKMAQEGKLPNR